MRGIAGAILLLCAQQCLAEHLFLKRPYPNVENGVFQLDRRGAPIKLVDVNYGHKWTIPVGPKGVEEYAVIPSRDGALEFSKGTNIIPGTTTRLYATDRKQAAKSAGDVKKEIRESRRKGIIQNLGSVSKKATAKAMYVEAAEVPEDADSTKAETEEERQILHEGEELGEKIKSSIERHSEESKKPSPLSIDILNQEIPKSIDELMKADLEEQRWLSRKSPSDRVCLRDYTKPCPVAWDAISSTQCKSPADYKGPCAHIMAFEPMTAQEKSELAKECGVNWACINESCGNGQRDYSMECPIDWTYSGKCEAPRDYSGGCDKTMDFGAYNDQEKEAFSSACKAIWPCKEESCERDYSISCPEGWSYNAGKDVCIAPKAFEEICSADEIQEISRMSYHQRMGFASKFGISWPCKKSCTFGFEKFACPRDWTDMMNSGVCKAPESYVAPYGCPRITHFDYMTNKEKEEFSRKCGVRWICEDQSLRNYSVCPRDFSYVSAGNSMGQCKPTAAYKGPCRETQDVLSLSQEQKYKFEETCQAPFPELKESEVPKSSQAAVLPKTFKKLLKGTSTTPKGITLE